MSKHKPPRRHPLEAFRISKFWSYVELADAIADATGLRQTSNGWRRICVGEVTPRRTTQEAIDQFLSARAQKAS